MKREKMKQTNIVFTSISFIMVLLGYLLTINNILNDNAFTYLFALIGISFLLVGGVAFNVVGIILSSIDLYKSSRENEPINLCLILLIINSCIFILCFTYRYLIEAIKLYVTS